MIWDWVLPWEGSRSKCLHIFLDFDSKNQGAKCVAALSAGLEPCGQAGAIRGSCN